MSHDLVAFDFDGTLSDSEMIVLLAERAGVADRVRRVTRRAMNDEIEYAESLRRRVALLEGLAEREADRALEGVELRPGAAELLGTLRGAGVRTAVVTGGFERGVERALDRADVAVDRVVANRLVVEGDRLTGEVAGPLVEGTKDEALRTVAGEYGVDLADVLVVGDGANDLPMIEAAGTGIGFRPSPTVRPHCDVVVESIPDLRDTLGRLGIPTAVEGDPPENLGGTGPRGTRPHGRSTRE